MLVLVFVLVVGICGSAQASFAWGIMPDLSCYTTIFHPPVAEAPSEILTWISRSLGLSVLIQIDDGGVRLSGDWSFQSTW
jgi:hypothetical protein